MEVEGCCLLCLEVKQELVEVIFIDSVQCNTLKIKNFLEKCFWTMQHTKDNSWLCVNCWTEIYDFHNFYMRIKKTHQECGMFTKKKDDKKDSHKIDFNEVHMNGLVECPVDDEININNFSDNEHHYENECHIIEFNETPNDSAINSNTSLPSSDTNPLLDIEVQKPHSDNFSSDQETKPRRSRKAKHKESRTKSVYNKVQNRKCRTKVSGVKEQIRLSRNKSKNIENKLLPEKEIKPEIIETVAENLSSRQEPFVITELEKEYLTPERNVEHKSETDAHSLQSPQMKLNQIKDMLNEKDKFLAENFKISCFLCEIPFDTFNDVLKHFKTQHKERGFIQCCDKKFYRRNVLIDHVNYHLNPNYFKCHQCVKVFEDRRRLELHCASHEVNNGKKFCCNICGKGFIKLGMLTAHKKTHISEEEKRFQCTECDKKFASNYMRANHCRTTHLKKYHKICEICGKSIQDKTIFERHMLQHDGKSAPSASCDICGLLLTDEKALERHKKVIHPENGQKVYTCQICSKVSPNMRSHKLHVRFTHESGYNYKCSLCDKAYKRPRSLKEHMASHTGEILYTCPWCPKTFNSNANMHNHRKKVHPKEWEETSRKRYSGKLPPRFKPPANVAS